MKYEALSWYETPLWYDLVFEEDTKKEASFLEEAVRRFGGGAKSSAAKGRVLEPACGSGRLVEEMARRGWRGWGFDGGRCGGVAKSSAAKGRVLEPACGSGRLVEEMARRGWRVSGFDASEAMLGFARERLRKARLRAELLQARMESFKLDGKFELAYCF